ncbi:MAG: hypothetical protein P1U86_11650 [Verrucomicrobiales bacterium]|nr:hypothetical protein [Verrucomicrobiales bacterium]
MKNDFPNHNGPLPGEERLVHAALEEHARLGSNRNDDALIERILLETVNKQSVTEVVAARSTAPWKSLLIGVGSAAAVLLLGFFFLQSFQVRDSEMPRREVHFVVQILEDAPVDASPPTTPPTVAASPNQGRIEPTFAKVDAVVRPINSGTDYFMETQFGKSLSQLPSKAEHHGFLISASKVRQTGRETQFDGDVVITHDTWKIKAAGASVPIAGKVEGDSMNQSPSLTAFDVVVNQVSPRRTVHAKTLNFDAVTGNLILTGVQSISSPEGEMKKFQASDRLTLTKTSYAIESLPVLKYASPPLLKPGRN